MITNINIACSASDQDDDSEDSHDCESGHCRYDE